MSGGAFDYLFRLAEETVGRADPVVAKGRVRQAIGTIIRAAAPGARIGDLCVLRNPSDGREILAEIVGLEADSAVLTPLEEPAGLSTSTEVVLTADPSPDSVFVGWSGPCSKSGRLLITASSRWLPSMSTSMLSQGVQYEVPTRRR